MKKFLNRWKIPIFLLIGVINYNILIGFARAYNIPTKHNFFAFFSLLLICSPVFYAGILYSNKTKTTNLALSRAIYCFVIFGAIALLLGATLDLLLAAFV